jgi:hypothetical protein
MNSTPFNRLHDSADDVTSGCYGRRENLVTWKYQPPLHRRYPNFAQRNKEIGGKPGLGGIITHFGPL